MQNPFLYILDTCEIIDLLGSIGKRVFPHYQYIFCTKGEGILCSEVSPEEKITTGTLVFLRENVFFSLRNISDNFCFRQIAFNGSMTKTYPQYFGFKSVMTFSDVDSEILEAFNSAYDLFNLTDPDDSHMMALYNLIGLCGEYIIEQRQKPISYEQFIINAVYAYVKANLKNLELDMSQFLLSYNLTEKELDNILMKHCQKTSAEFIYYYRMETAKSLILKQYSNDFKDCGYASRRDFNEAFYRYAGQNPSEYLRVLYPDYD